MKRSKELKDLIKERLTHLKFKPSVDPNIISIPTIYKNINCIKKEQLIAFLTNADSFSFSLGSCYGDIRLITFNKESHVNHLARIQKYNQNLEIWTARLSELDKLIEEATAADLAKKKARDAKYQDPQYIEYLRLQAIIKEKGYE